MPAIDYKPVRTIDWKGLSIKIENPAGSVRRGVSKAGEKWSVTMPYDYGFIANTKGVDGDEVDVFIGPNKAAKFVYIMHQVKYHSGEFDEQKCFLGFNDAMDAQQAYRKAYDLPDLFIGTLETIPFDAFKEKVLKTKENSVPIHASKMNTVISLYADSKPEEQAKVGDSVTVDGEHGRGVVTHITNGVAIVKFRSGLYVSRSLYNIHKISSDYVNPYYSGRRLNEKV